MVAQKTSLATKLPTELPSTYHPPQPPLLRKTISDANKNFRVATEYPARKLTPKLFSEKPHVEKGK